MEINVLKKLPNIFYLICFDTVSSYGTNSLVPTLKDVENIKKYYEELAKEIGENYNIRIYKYHLTRDDLEDLEYDADNFIEFMDDYPHEVIDDIIVTLNPYF